MTVRKTFVRELTELDKSLREMGRFVEDSIDRLVEVMEKQDRQQALIIIKSDRDVNDMERGIEAKCLSLITRQQPVAGDLRIVSAALKAVTDLEGIGNHAADIAGLLTRCGRRDFSQISPHLPAMTRAAKEMVHNGINAFADRSLPDAKAVITGDDVVDELFNRVKYDIVMNLKTEKADVDSCIDLLMIAKYLEKIGDHAVNIAEWEIFRETGVMENVRLL